MVASDEIVHPIADGRTGFPSPPPRPCAQVLMAAAAFELLAERLHELHDQSARVVSEGTQHAAEVTQRYQLQAERLEETLGAQVVALEAKLKVRGTGMGRGGVINS